MEDEIWVNTHIYRNRYMVSNRGRVKSLIGNSERILKPRKTKLGYLQVCLTGDEGNKWSYVHRLVAEAFIPNILELEEIDHIDGDRTNNVTENLTWVTRKWNMENPITRIRMRNRRRKRFVGTKVVQYTKSGEKVAEYDTIAQAADTTGICNACIGFCINGRTKTSGGYVWRRENIK